MLSPLSGIEAEPLKSEERNEGGQLTGKRRKRDLKR
jgi:hypothetical protein